MKHSLLDLFRRVAAGVLITSIAMLSAGCSDEFWDDLDSYDENGDPIVQTDDESGGENSLSEYLLKGTGLEEQGAEGTLDVNSSIKRTKSPIRSVAAKSITGTALSSDFYMYRDALSTAEQKAYDQICTGIMAGQKSVNMSVAVSKSRIEAVYYSVYYDHPEFIWSECGFSYSYDGKGIVTVISPNYNALADNITQSFSDFENALSPLLAECATFGKDIDKVRYVHDYLAYTITYQLNCAYNQSAYSAAVNKITVCAGYAHTFQYCMMKLGIPCAYVTGDAGGSHAWNLLCLDGEYYCMDVTWDDPSGGTQYVTYNYFNITDSQLQNDHTRGNLSAVLPSCNGTKYSYANYFGSGYGSDLSLIDSSVKPSKPETDAANGNTTTPDTYPVSPVTPVTPDTSVTPDTPKDVDSILNGIINEFDLNEDNFDWESYYNYLDDYYDNSDSTDTDDFDWSGDDFGDFDYDDDYWDKYLDELMSDDDYSYDYDDGYDDDYSYDYDDDYDDDYGYDYDDGYDDDYGYDYDDGYDDDYGYDYDDDYDDDYDYDF